jgi:hypothetical protein
MMVDSRDVGFFYKLLGSYHASRNDFISAVMTFIEGNDGRQEKSIKSSMAQLHQNDHGNSQGDSKGSECESNESFYSAVCSRCTCGTCFNKFASYRREPWIPRGDGVFTNCKLGVVKVTECPVKDLQMSGYIYVTESEWNRQNKIIENNTKTILETAKREKDHIKVVGEQITEMRKLEEIRKAEAEQLAKDKHQAKLQREREEKDRLKSKYNNKLDQIDEAIRAIESNSELGYGKSDLDEDQEGRNADTYALKKYNETRDPVEMRYLTSVERLYQNSDCFEGKPAWQLKSAERKIEKWRQDYFDLCDKKRAEVQRLQAEKVELRSKLQNLGSDVKSDITDAKPKSTPMVKKKRRMKTIPRFVNPQ